MRFILSPKQRSDKLDRVQTVRMEDGLAIAVPDITDRKRAEELQV
jgi:hypothetical protein